MFLFKADKCPKKLGSPFNKIYTAIAFNSGYAMFLRFGDTEPITKTFKN